jgi:hypothetical protein
MKINKIISQILIPIIILLIYFYLRFIKERLPKDIPFALTVIGFFLLLNACCIYVFIIYNLLKKKHKTNIIISEIVQRIYQPFENLDSKIKESIDISYFYKYYFIPLMFKLENLLDQNYVFTILFQLLPRVIMVITLAIDTYYFHKLHYIYNVVLISLLLLVGRYLLYSLQKLKEALKQELFFFIDKITLVYIKGVLPDDDEDDDEDDDDDYPPTMTVDLEIFLNLQVYACKEGINLDYQCIYRSEYIIETKKNVGVDYIDYMEAEVAPKIDLLLAYAFVLESCDATYIINKNIKTIKILIFINYLLCWLNILIWSMVSLDINELLLCINSTWKNVLEPFSDNIIN